MADSRTENEINEPVIGTGWQAVKWEHLFPGDNGKNKRDHGMKLYESGHVMFVTETKKASGSLIEGYCTPQTNVNENAYRIWAEIDDDRVAIHDAANCSCWWGGGG